MTEAHWFANLCPFFSVFDLDKYKSYFGHDAAIEVERMAELSFFKSADWLRKFEGSWKAHKEISRRAHESAQKGDFELIFWEKAITQKI